MGLWKTIFVRSHLRVLVHFLFRRRHSHPNLTWFSVARYHGVTLVSDRRAPSLGAQGLCNSRIPHPIVDFVNFSPCPYICAFTRKKRLRLRPPETWMCRLLSVYKLKVRLTTSTSCRQPHSWGMSCCMVRCSAARFEGYLLRSRHLQLHGHVMQMHELNPDADMFDVRT